jgi:hypothetical protein
LTSNITNQLEEPQQTPSGFTPLAQTILDQPASFLDPKKQDETLAFAAKLALAICLKLSSPNPEKTCNAVKQLFRSKTDDWAFARESLHIEQEIDADQSNVTQVVRNFLEQKQQLLRISIPSLESFFKRTGENSKDLGEAELQDPESITPPAKALKPPKAPDDTSPDFKLFETQILRAMHADVSDPYRLPNNWNRQSNQELYISIQRLRFHLRQDGEAHRDTRLHSATRFISLFAGLSLKTCLQLPIDRGVFNTRGSMHLDLACGVLRRDALCAALRKHRPGKRRTNGRWWRLPLPPEVTAVLLEASESQPAARTLGDLIQAAGLSHASCQHLLNDNFPTSHRPEDARFAFSFRTCLLDLDVHPAMVARVSGDITTTPNSDHFYLTFTANEVHEVMVKFCDWAGLIPPKPPANNRLTGSPKAMQLEDFQSLVQCLNQTVLSARNRITPRSRITEVVEFHNLYTKAVALQIILGHGGRGNMIGRMTCGRLFASANYLALSDRRTDPYSKQRILPLTEIFSQGNGLYREHLDAMSKRLARHAQDDSKVLLKIFPGKQLHSSPFAIFTVTKDGWDQRSLKRSDLVELLVQLGKQMGKDFDQESLNIGRHFFQTALVNKQVAQPAIEAFLGHHTNGAEVFGYGSGISVREVCDYLRPVVTEIQRGIGFVPLGGLGRTAERFLKLPDIAIQKNLRPLPAKLLLKKLANHDLVIPDLVMREQDPPSTSKTLVAHTTLQDLKFKYHQSACISTHLAGAAMFCLIAEELVLSEPEQKALFLASLSNGLWRVGEMVIAEAEHDGRPVAQRILHESTQAAVFKLRRTQPCKITTEDDVAQSAYMDLHDLLIELVSSWPCSKPNESARLLATMSSHWAAVEIAAGAMFGVYHKAPFIPARDLARIFYKQPRSYADNCVKQHSAFNWTKSPNFKYTDKILTKWANKDAPLGESLSRAAGCTRDLKNYLKRPDLSLAQQLHAELLIADLSETAPYKTLDASTLPSYSNKYQLFFKIVEEEETCDLEPEHFQQAFNDMGGGSSMTESALPRWAMLHICAYLHGRGHWVPAALTTDPATKTPRPARIPVYTSAPEIQQIGNDLVEYFGQTGGNYAFVQQRLELERSAPMRAAELRYSRPIDFDLPNRIFHITTSGHDHLKNVASRGSVPLTPQISNALEALKVLRHDIGVGAETLMFADAHLEASYQPFDEIALAIRQFTAERTGCPEFRRHDFRSSASTNFCFDVEASIDTFGKGICIDKNCSEWTAKQVTERFIRFAKAARFSRHASVATTLRFYNCSGPLDIYHQICIANSRIEPSGIYASQVIERSAQSTYVLKDRHQERKKLDQCAPTVTYASLVQDHLRNIRQQLPIPSLRGPNNLMHKRDTHQRKPASRSEFVQASLLAQTGMSLAVAAGALNLPVESVQLFQISASTYMEETNRAPQRKDSAPALSSRLDPDGPTLQLGTSIAALSRWLTSPQSCTAHGKISIRLAIGKSPSTLSVADADHLLDLLPILKGISLHGFRVLLRIASGHVLSTNPQIYRKLAAAGIETCCERGKGSGLGSISFCLRHKSQASSNSASALQPSPDDISPRSLGIAGRVVVFGLVLALLCL